MREATCSTIKKKNLKISKFPRSLNTFFIHKTFQNK